MKNNMIMKKIAIAAVMFVLVALAVLCEYGIANLLDIHYMGMSYQEYAAHISAKYPWAIWVELVLTVAGVIAFAHYEVQEIENLIIKIKEKLK